MSRWSRSMSPAALVLSILALVVATSAGTAYAAVQIGTKQLKNGAVTSAKIRDGGVQSVDLRNGGVTGTDIADGHVALADVAPATRLALRGARAYATVDPSPSGSGVATLLAARTRGFTAIQETGVGTMCLTVDPALGIDLATVTVLTAVDELGTVGVSEPRATWDRTTDCGAGKIQVHTYNGAAASESVGFTVLIG